MKTLIHLCKKDFAFAKHGLLGAWAVFLVAALMPVLMTGALMEAAAPFLGLVFAATLFQIFAATLRILRADSFTGGNAFIGTRPLTKTMLCFSKLAGTALFVLVPYLLAQVIGVLALRVQLAPVDWGLLLLEKTLFFGVPAGVALIVGTHTRNFVWATLLTIALAAANLWLGNSIFGRPGGYYFIAEARHLKASQWLVGQAWVCAATIMLAWLWIVRRSLSWSIGAGILAIAAIAGVSKQWKVNFVNRIALSELDGTSMAKDLRITWLGKPQISGMTRNKVPFTTVTREATVRGVREGWLAYPMGIRSQARFRDGGVVTSETLGSSIYGDASRKLLPSLGIHRPKDHPENEDRWSFSNWFEAEASLLRAHTDKSCSISGEATIELYQPIMLADLPAEAGASAGHGRYRYRLGRIQASEGAIAVEVAVLSAGLLSKGETSNPHDAIEILLINPKTGEHTGAFTGTNSASGQGWKTLRQVLRIEESSPGQRTSDPMTFLKDARLYLIGSRYGGTVRVPFEMPGIDLEAGR